MSTKKLNPKQGERLRNCIKDRFMTQKELGNRSGYTPQYISSIVNGKKRLSAEAALSFSKILDVRPEYLLGQDNHKKFLDVAHFENKKKEYLFECIYALIEANGYEWLCSFIRNWDAIDRSPYANDVKSYADMINKGDPEYSHKVMVQAEIYNEIKRPNGERFECSHEDFDNAVNQIYHFAAFVMESLFRKYKDYSRKASDQNRIDTDKLQFEYTGDEGAGKE